MVTAHRAQDRLVPGGISFAWVKRPLAALGRDAQGWWQSIRARLPLRPGLFTFFLNPPGGQRRIHLRIDGGGSGVLFVDAADTIHLNPSATVIVKAALDGLPRRQIAAILKGRFNAVQNGEIQRHVDRMYNLVDHISTTIDSCPTCGLEAEHPPPFSVPITAPYKADLALTYRCNNACRHCYNRDESRLKKSPLPLGDDQGLASVPEGEGLSLRQWQKVLRKLAKIGVPHVIFTGGEPTLHPGLTELIRTAEGLGLITGLNTNGRRLAERAFTDSLSRAKVSHVQITLESCRADIHNYMTRADSFQETCRGIENAISVGLHVITNTTLTRLNADHALETVDFLHDLGLRAFAMNGMIFSGHGLTSGDAIELDQLRYLLPAVRDRARALGMRFLWYTPTDYCRLSPLELELGPKRCNAGEYSICIEPNGDVLPCQSYYVAAGNILRDPWRRIWDSDLFRGFRLRADRPESGGLSEHCRQCPDLAVCGGGCRLEKIKNEGNQSV